MAKISMAEKTLQTDLAICGPYILVGHSKIESTVR